MEPSKDRKKYFEQNRNDTAGVNCSDLGEVVPIYAKAPCETVYEGKNNSFIVFGRDRPGAMNTGYGGLGSHQAGSLDVVVGRGSPFPMEESKNQTAFIDNSYEFDACRIVMSQKTDIDDNFRLTNDKLTFKSNGDSAIGIKADHVRMMSRKSLRLVSGCDRYDSRGNIISQASGIDLVANNNDKELQPIPVGDNLVSYLKNLQKTVQGHNSEITYLYNIISQLLQVLSVHIHQVGVVPTTPSPELATISQLLSAQIMLHVTERQTEAFNSSVTSMKFLEKFGPEFINSLYNRTN